MMFDYKAAEAIREIGAELQPECGSNDKVYERLVAKYLEFKPRRPKYWVTYADEGELYYELQILDDEDIDDIIATVSQFDSSGQRDINDLIREHSDQLQDKPYFDADLGEVKYVDINKRSYYYNFQAAVYSDCGIDRLPDIYDMPMNIPDDKYVMLVAAMLCTKRELGYDLTFNGLRAFDHEVFNALSDLIEAQLGCDHRPSPMYVVEMTELNKDVDSILSILGEE